MNEVQYEDNMESYFLAETLKYSVSAAHPLAGSFFGRFSCAPFPGPSAHAGFGSQRVWGSVHV